MNDLYVLLQLILSCIRTEDESEATARKGVVYVHVQQLGRGLHKCLCARMYAYISIQD